MITHHDYTRRKAVHEHAIETSSLRNRETVATSEEINKGKTQYLEKVALGAAATVAAVVSFLGSHSAKLHPHWLLRTALIALVVTMTAAMLRNWLYPFYVLSVRLAMEHEAKQKEARSEAALVELGNAYSFDDGRQIDVKAFSKRKHEDEAAHEKLSSKFRDAERDYWSWTVGLENIALGMALISMLLLVCLAWFNF